MRAQVRIVTFVLGLAVAVYGVASLTGGWLGTPPWWWRKIGVPASADTNWRPIAWRFFEERRGREWISGGVVAAGTALTAFGAWPRRRPTGVSP